MYFPSSGLCDVFASDMFESVVSSDIDRPVSLASYCNDNVSHLKILDNVGMAWTVGYNYSTALWRQWRFSLTSDEVTTWMNDYMSHKTIIA